LAASGLLLLLPDRLGPRALRLTRLTVILLLCCTMRAAIFASMLVGASAHGALYIPTPRNSQDNVLPQFANGRSPATPCTCVNGNGNGKEGCERGLRGQADGQSCLWWSQGCSIGCAKCATNQGGPSAKLSPGPFGGKAPQSGKIGFRTRCTSPYSSTPRPRTCGLQMHTCCARTCPLPHSHELMCVSAAHADCNATHNAAASATNPHPLMNATLPKEAWTLNIGAVEGSEEDSYRYNPWRARERQPQVASACYHPRPSLPDWIVTRGRSGVRASGGPMWPGWRRVQRAAYWRGLGVHRHEHVEDGRPGLGHAATLQGDAAVGRRHASGGSLGAAIQPVGPLLLLRRASFLPDVIAAPACPDWLLLLLLLLQWRRLPVPLVQGRSGPHRGLSGACTQCAAVCYNFCARCVSPPCLLPVSGGARTPAALMTAGIRQACFQKTPLDFDRTKQMLVWNTKSVPVMPGVKAPAPPPGNGTTLRFPVSHPVFVDVGTWPKGSTWARDPIPRVQDCEQHGVAPHN
jgi:hypothetical protein